MAWRATDVNVAGYNCEQAAAAGVAYDSCRRGSRQLLAWQSTAVGVAGYSCSRGRREMQLLAWQAPASGVAGDH